MEMFEGKRGPRIYKRRTDAEFVAERRNKAEEARMRIFEIRVSDEEKAQDVGASVRPDLSIAARKPKEGEKGWILVQGSEKLEEKYGHSFEVLSENIVG